MDTLASNLTKDQFKKLTTTNDCIAFLHLFIRLIINILLISSLIYISREGFILILFLVWIIYATQFHFWGFAGIGHEFLHNRVFSSKALNNFLYQLCSALTWNNSAMFSDSHMLHHRDTFSKGDIEAKSVQNWTLIYFLGYLLIDLRGLFQKIFYVVINAFGYYPNFISLDSKYVRSAKFTLVLNLGLYSFFYLLSGDLIVTALLFISPFSCSLLNKILAKSQHLWT